MSTLLRLFGLESGADVYRAVDSSWHVTRHVPAVWWYGVLAVGLALALLNFSPRVSMRPGLRCATFALRLGMLGLLLLVLAGVEWRVLLELNEPQRWVALIDDSASMATRDAGETSRYEAAFSDLESLRDAAAGRVKLETQTFSGAAPLPAVAGQGPTLIEQAVRRAALSRVHPHRLILLTDGRDSQRRHFAALGGELAAHNIQLDVRLYGSANTPTDAGVSAEPARNVIRWGEELVVQGAVTGHPTGEQTTIVVKEDGKEINSFAVTSKDNWRFQFIHKPKEKGQRVYSFELPAGDTVALNNSVSFPVNVVEEKINVLLIEGFPRNEFKLIKAVLEVDPLVNLVSIAQIPGGGVYVQGTPLHRNPEQGLITSQADLFSYDVVILRDLARSYFRAGGDTSEPALTNIVQFVTKRGGGLVVTGGQDAYRAGGYETSALAEILPFDLSDQISGQPQFEGLFHVLIPKPAYQHPLLRLLPEESENRERLESLRQLDGSNNVGRFKPLATPLMTRSVKLPAGEGKIIEREVPILGYMAVGEGKVLATSVDTLWRWQLQPDFEDPPLTMLLANAVRYLAPPPGKKPGTPHIDMQASTPQVGQDLLLTTELRDANFDPLVGEEVLVSVTRPDETTFRMFPRDLPEEPGLYQYRVPLEQPGPYKVVVKHRKAETTREFLAGASAGEYADLSSDRPAMEQLVSAARGTIAPENISAWLDAFDYQPAQVRAQRDLQVWNSPLVLILFLGLVCLDCYLRKRQGLV